MPKILILFFSLLISKPTDTQHVFSQTTKLMGCRFDISVVESDSARAQHYIDMAIEEINRIENLISSWKSDSETSKINQNAGIRPVQVSSELFGLIERSIVLSKLSDGAFDISYASIDKIWKFDGSMTAFPDEEVLKKSIEKIGYQNIELNKARQTVFLKKEGMKIGFGGIGKGFAADKAKELLMSNGALAGIINASGDLNSWGKQPNGKPWSVAITNPMNKNKAFAILPLTTGAVVTSGDYEKFVMFGDKRYAHIINPKTGIPTMGIISVSVFAQSAELADALATSVFVMGIETGLDRIDQIENIECIIIDDEGKIHTSKNISINED